MLKQIYWPQRPPGGSTGVTGSWRRGVFWGSRDETWTWSPWGSAPSSGPADQSLCSATWCAGPARMATMDCSYPLCLEAEQNFTVKLCLEEDDNNAEITNKGSVCIAIIHIVLSRISIKLCQEEDGINAEVTNKEYVCTAVTHIVLSRISLFGLVKLCLN